MTDKATPKNRMRTLSIIVIFTILCACENRQVTNEILHSNNLPQDSLIASSATNTSRPSLLNQDRFKNENFDIREVNDTFGLRYYCKSKNYDITIRYHKNGRIFIEYVEDKNNHLQDTKEFYDNGQLKEEGTMTAVHHNYVGTWKFYSLTGNPDSIVDYDRKYKISYFKALEIAKTENLTLPDIDITLETENKKTVWRVLKRTNAENQKTSAGIDINAATGQITNTPNIIGISDCVRGTPEPVVIKTIYPKTTFKLQSDSLTAFETIDFNNGDKLVIKNWGCEYYCLTFRFETGRFQDDTTNIPFWYRKIVLLISEVTKGIDAPINIQKGNSALINHIDHYNKLKLGDEIDFGGSEIRDFVTVDRITKLADKKFAIEVTFSTGPL